jgi:hypothetical protein
MIDWILYLIFLFIAVILVSGWVLDFFYKLFFRKKGR